MLYITDMYQFPSATNKGVIYPGQLQLKVFSSKATFQPDILFPYDSDFDSTPESTDTTLDINPPTHVPPISSVDVTAIQSSDSSTTSDTPEPPPKRVKLSLLTEPDLTFGSNIPSSPSDSDDYSVSATFDSHMYSEDSYTRASSNPLHVFRSRVLELERLELKHQLIDLSHTSHVDVIKRRLESPPPRQFNSEFLVVSFITKTHILRNVHRIPAKTFHNHPSDTSHPHTVIQGNSFLTNSTGFSPGLGLVNIVQDSPCDYFSVFSANQQDLITFEHRNVLYFYVKNSVCYNVIVVQMAIIMFHTKPFATYPPATPRYLPLLLIYHRFHGRL
jgi:hypothetical protein